MDQKMLAYIGRQLRFAREQKEFSQDQVANQLKISQNFYSKWENGQHQFSFLQLCEIARILNICLADLDPMFLKYTQSKRRRQNREAEEKELEDIRCRNYERLLLKKESIIAELEMQLKTFLQKELPYGL